MAGADLVITVGGVDVSDMVSDEVVIIREESTAALADFTIITPPGIQTISDYHGKQVRISLAGEVTRLLYTGIVDLPEVDLINKRIRLKCSDNRAQKIAALSRSYVRTIGSWSKAVFGDAEDIAQELEQRLETVPAAFDFDSQGVARFIYWLPKSTPDFQLADDAVYYRKPTVSVLTRGRVTNNITVELDFQYVRLRHRQINYTFESGLSPCYYDGWGLPPTNVQVQQAIEQAGWPYTSYTSTGLDPAGFYDCSGDGRRDTAWSPVTHYASVAPKLDENGEQVTDANGNSVYSQTGRTTVDNTAVYAQTASWVASRRWAQSISEKFTLRVKAPQSIAQYGQVDSTVSFGYRSEYDPSGWEDYQSYSPAPGDFATSANGDKYLDKPELQAFADMALCAINRAKTQILKAHRDNRVNFETPLWPEIELHHTVETTGGTVRAKGKVRRIAHTFDVGTRACSTDVELALYQSIGSATDDDVTVPARPSVADSAGGYSPSVSLTTVDITGDEIPESAQGYVFKKLTSTLKTPVAFIVKTPEIEDVSRDTREVSAAQTYNVEIPNDTLEIEF